MSGVVQDIGEKNEENESSTELAETSSTIKEFFTNGKGPTTLRATLNQDESVATTFTTESTDTPLTTSVEEESTPTSVPTSGSSEPKGDTGEKGDGEEATTMMGAGEEEDVTTSKVNEDFETKRHETSNKSGGAVVEYRVNERDLNQGKGCFINTILTSSFQRHTTTDHSELPNESEFDRGNEIVIEWGGNETEVRPTPPK